MVAREQHLRALADAFQLFPVVGLQGPRQIGKTTLARTFARSGDVHLFDLEWPPDLDRLADPAFALAPLTGLVVIDEVQRRPEILPVLRVLVDRPDARTKFLLLGSASSELLKLGSESLAGRILWHELDGFRLSEIGTDHTERRWFRGGFPEFYLAKDDRDSFVKRRAFIRTFLERDLPTLGVRVAPAAVERFWQMLAHMHGQLWSGAELARALSLSEPTVRSYRDLLESAGLLRVLRPWFDAPTKRMIKSPKVYLRDTGLLHALLRLERIEDLLGHPRVGASWEGFVLEQVIAHLGAEPDQIGFWGTHSGAELDLVIQHGNRRVGYEFKRSGDRRVTPSMRSAMSELNLHALWLVHGGSERWPMAPGINAIPAADLMSLPRLGDG